MREDLKDTAENDYWVYGISEGDFDYAVELIQDAVNLRTERFNTYMAEVRERDPESADDILDDVAYYKYLDEQHLWQHALLRLQGLIEAVMTSEFANLGEGVRLFGLTSKIRAIKAEGYTLSEEEKNELILWGNLRNAIAHAPPEQYRPVITKDDVLEYYELVKAFYLRWSEEKVNNGAA